MQAEGDAVACAPGDERPRGAVPESAEEHGHEQVDILPYRAPTVATERDVEVIPKPERERDVPPTPKLGDVSRAVREIEVNPQIETEDGAQPDGHIAVAREVAIDLQPISQSAHEKLDARVA